MEPTPEQMIALYTEEIAASITAMVYAAEKSAPGIHKTSLLIMAESLTAMLRTIVGTDEADRVILEAEEGMVSVIESISKLGSEVMAYLKTL